MTNERKEQLIQRIRAVTSKHPGVRVTCSWSMFDRDHSGVRLSAQHAATGNVLCAAQTDDDLDTMSDEDVASWAKAAMHEYTNRQRETRRAIAAERKSLES